MNNTEYIFSRLKTTIESDKLQNSDSLKRLVSSDIMRALSTYLVIDAVNSSIELVPDGAGLQINAHIKASSIKTLGR